MKDTKPVKPYLNQNLIMLESLYWKFERAKLIVFLIQAS
jgi:hypothetical protein